MIHVNDAYYDGDYFTQQEQGLRKHPVLSHCDGVRFAVCTSDTAQWIALCLYLKSAGASVFPIHPATPLEAARRLAARTQCHFLLFHDLDEVIAVDTRGPDQFPVLVQMSSGTTGAPKCIERRWTAVDLEVASYVSTFRAADHMTPVIACPVTHSYGLICGVLVALKRGLQPVVITNINPKYCIKKMKEQVNPLLYSSPAFIHTLIKLLPQDQMLYAVITSGAMMPKSWFMHLKQKTVHLYQQYGCSEAGCVAINQDMQQANELGHPLPHLRVATGSSLTHPGEIQVELDGQIIRTRDLGYFNPEGSLCFLARIDDTINVAGINVYPQEVEDVFLELPEIADAVVYKKEDAYSGERVCLKFVARESVDIGRLRAWCVNNLSPHQVPVDIQQVSEIPKLANGKVNRKAMVEAPAALSA